jgi:hypothetical protein
MLFLRTPRRAKRNGHPTPCPQPYCRHGSHGGIPVPTRHCGTSHLNGLVVHHVRCIANPAHHLQFVRVGRTWQRVRV